MNEYMMMSIDELYETIQKTKQRLKALQKLYEVRQEFGERTQRQIADAQRRKNKKKKSSSEDDIDDLLNELNSDTVESQTGTPSAGACPQENTIGISEA